jgi:DNA-binding transcriptional LysR family regulator
MTMARPKKQSLMQSLKLERIRTVRNARPHDVRALRVSLKQWRILHAVVDCGGFAGAARFLHLSQSAISYTIAQLQEQLGTPLLVIAGRKAQLTDAGRTLLNRSRHLLRDALEIEDFARHLGQGWGAEVALVVDHNFPPPLLMQALRRFSQLGCDLRVRLNEVPMHEVEEALRAHAVDLAISSQVPLGFLGDPLLEVEHVAVAHAAHPLFRLRKEIDAADLERHTQIVICNTKCVVRNSTEGLAHVRRWSVSSFDTALEAVSEALGYAWLPRHRIQKWLDQGTLLPLPLTEGRVYRVTLYLVHGRSWGSSLSATRLAEMLRSIAGAGQEGGRPDSANPAAA